MIINTQDLRGYALTFVLYRIQGGEQHKSRPHMWYFPDRKLTIAKSAWAPWINGAQAFELLKEHNLCVWNDMEGWHAGAYEDATTERPAVFVDADTPEMALCLAVIAKHCGEQIDIHVSLLDKAETGNKGTGSRRLMCSSDAIDIGEQA